MGVRVLEALENIAVGNRGGRYKAPEFDGTGDVSLFERQFCDVVAANLWDEQAAIQHLRRSLVGKANE